MKEAENQKVIIPSLELHPKIANDLANLVFNYDKYKYVTFDTETTGTQDYDEVIEIACTEHDIYGNCGNTIHYMCEPFSGYIHHEASRVNNIFMKDVIGEPSYFFSGVMQVVAKFIGPRTLIAHNFPFDGRMSKIKPCRSLCTLKMAKKFWPGSSYRHNLKACCNRVGLGWDDEKAHRATYDVLKAIELFTWFNNQDGAEIIINEALDVKAKKADGSGVYM